MELRINSQTVKTIDFRSCLSDSFWFTLINFGIAFLEIRQFLVHVCNYRGFLPEYPSVFCFTLKTLDVSGSTFGISFQDIRQFLVHAGDADVAPADGAGRGEELELGDDADDSDDECYARALQRLVHRTPQLPDRTSVIMLGSWLMIHSNGGSMISQRGRQPQKGVPIYLAKIC